MEERHHQSWRQDHDRERGASEGWHQHRRLTSVNVDDSCLRTEDGHAMKRVRRILMATAVITLVLAVGIVSEVVAQGRGQAGQAAAAPADPTPRWPDGH